FVLLDRELGDLAVLNLGVERAHVYGRGAAALRPRECLIEQHRAEQNQDPEDDLSDCGTQNLFLPPTPIITYFGILCRSRNRPNCRTGSSSYQCRVMNDELRTGFHSSLCTLHSSFPKMPAPNLALRRFGVICATR